MFVVQNVLIALRAPAHLDIWASENPEWQVSQSANVRHSIACLPILVCLIVSLQVLLG